MTDSSNLQSHFRCPPPWIMGILNVTPDSFSDGGQCTSPKDAETQMNHCFAAGAHIVDIGAESTAPGRQAIAAEEELRRLKTILPQMPPAGRMLSLDTYKASIAEYALQNGVTMINDVSALRADSSMVSILAEHKPWLVMMFAKGDGHLPHANEEARTYKDIVLEISEFLLERANFAIRQGISAERVILDPGMGKFISNNPNDSFLLLERMEEFCERVAPFPVLLGISRKGFIGGKLEDRDVSSQQLAAQAVKKGVQIIRTHNVPLASAVLHGQ